MPSRKQFVGAKNKFSRRTSQTIASPSDADLAAAVELNNAERLRLEGRLPWVEFHDEGDAIRVFAGDTWPENRVALARFATGDAHRRVGEILAPHLKQKVACNWVVGPVSQSPELTQQLRVHGFSCRIHCAGMACDLTKLLFTPPSLDGLSITLTDEPALLEPLTTEHRRQQHKGRSALSRLMPRQVWFFSASAGGQPVGETVLILGAGVAGIYGVEVLKEFRRRGIGTALVHAALVQARKQFGQRTAVLSATGMGKGVYARLGFREVCKLSFWKYGKLRQQRTPAQILIWRLLSGSQ